MAKWNGSVDNRPADWHKLRRQTLLRDPTCRIAGPGCTGRSTEADHITPRARGGSHDLDNLQGACSTCHFAKTLAERPVRRRASETHPGVIA